MEDSPEQVVGVDLSGLASDWESCRAIRNLLLESGSVVFNLPGKYHPTDSVAGVGVNLPLLGPLMPKLWVSDVFDYGQVGMVTIPALEKQFPGNILASAKLTFSWMFDVAILMQIRCANIKGHHC